MVLIILSSLRFTVWLSIWSILENVPCELEANKFLTLIFILAILPLRERQRDRETEKAGLKLRAFCRQLLSWAA